MNLKHFHLLALFSLSLTGYAQEQKAADTVVVPLAESSKIIFTVGNPKDLEVLRHYNYQKLFDDILYKLEENAGFDMDSLRVARERNSTIGSPDREDTDVISREDDGETEWDTHDDEEDNDDYDDDHKWERNRRGRIGETWQSYNIDLGTNNYLEDGQFPDGSEPYAVRPWGSWYVALNSVQRTRLGKNFFLEWGLGVSWYNFKFQEDNILIQKDEFGIRFETDTRDVDYIKSKLSATFINASLVPVLDFSDNSRKPRVWDGHGGGFRLGVGPYVGYRIGSKSKLVYEVDGDRSKEKDHDSLYLNSLRYGLRLQLGMRSTDLFINYDMNDLFVEEKGPKLNAISFGLTF